MPNKNSSMQHRWFAFEKARQSRIVYPGRPYECRCTRNESGRQPGSKKPLLGKFTTPTSKHGSLGNQSQFIPTSESCRLQKRKEVTQSGHGSLRNQSQFIPTSESCSLLKAKEATHKMQKNQSDHTTASIKTAKSITQRVGSLL
jgi:hypothetical protein